MEITPSLPLSLPPSVRLLLSTPPPPPPPPRIDESCLAVVRRRSSRNLSLNCGAAPCKIIICFPGPPPPPPPPDQSRESFFAWLANTPPHPGPAPPCLPARPLACLPERAGQGGQAKQRIITEPRLRRRRRRRPCPPYTATRLAFSTAAACGL